MSLIGEIFGQRATAIYGAGPGSTIFSDLYGSTSASGNVVSPRTSLGIPALYRAVDLISSTIARLPLILYERKGERDRERATGHRLYPLLHDEPNREMTAITFRRAQVTNRLLTGNSYAEIQRDGGNRPVALWHLPSSLVTPRRLFTGPGGTPTTDLNAATDASRRDGGLIWYEINVGGPDSPKWIQSADMFHVLDLCLDGLNGISRITAAREAIGLALAQQDFGAATFGNAAAPGGVLERPAASPPLSPEGEARLLRAWELAHKGPKRAGRVAVLQEGTVYKPVQVSMADAQWLEGRKDQVLEIARLFGTPPHLLMHMDAAHFNNIEHQGIEFVTLALAPALVADQQEISRKLLSASERPRFFAEYETKALLIGDSATRAEFYRAGIDGGFMTTSEAARAENLPPVPPEQGGDKYRWPLNYSTAEERLEPKQPVPAALAAAQAGPEPATPAPGPSPQPDEEARSESRSHRSVQARSRLREHFAPLVSASVARVIAVEAGKISKALEAMGDAVDPDRLAEFLRDFYATHGSFVERQVGPALAAYLRAVAVEAVDEVGADQEALRDTVERFTLGYSATYGDRYAKSHGGQLAALIGTTGLLALRETISQRLAEWTEKSPAKEARWEMVRGAAKMSREVYRGAGIRVMRWAKNANACQLCSEMDGRAVEIEGAFLRPGDEVEGSADQTDLSVKRLISGPPLHEGCTCSLVAG